MFSLFTQVLYISRFKKKHKSTCIFSCRTPSTGHTFDDIYKLIFQIHYIGPRDSISALGFWTNFLFISPMYFKCGKVMYLRALRKKRAHYVYKICKFIRLQRNPILCNLADLCFCIQSMVGEVHVISLFKKIMYLYYCFIFQ